MRAGAGVLWPLLELGWGPLPAWDRVAGACETAEAGCRVALHFLTGVAVAHQSPATSSGRVALGAFGADVVLMGCAGETLCGSFAGLIQETDTFVTLKMNQEVLTMLHLEES